jgi:hypothetical protein
MKRLLRRCAAILPLLPMLLASAPALADSYAIDPEAEKILRSMSSYLGGLSAFSVRASVENEIITDEGQKRPARSTTLSAWSNSRPACRRRAPT